MFLGTICWLANLKRFSDGYLNFCLVREELRSILRENMKEGVLVRSYGF